MCIADSIQIKGTGLLLADVYYCVQTCAYSCQPYTETTMAGFIVLLRHFVHVAIVFVARIPGTVLPEPAGGTRAYPGRPTHSDRLPHI